MIETKTIHWLAGLLEGEAAFTNSCQWPGLLRIEFTSTDLDVALRVSHILNCPYTIRPSSTLTKKQAYQVRLARRAEAAGWMMTLYPLMGVRRKAKIRELLGKWRSTKSIKRRGLET